jgi:DNA-directed RNA polymerase subunit RPC12/RpoP
MNYPENVERRARIIAEHRALMAKPPFAKCTVCFKLLKSRAEMRCEECHAKDIAKQRERDNMPVGRKSSLEADELRELLDVPMSALHHTVGGGKRVIRSTRGL